MSDVSPPPFGPNVRLEDSRRFFGPRRVSDSIARWSGVGIRVEEHSSIIVESSLPSTATYTALNTLIKMPVLPAPPLHDQSPFVVLSDWVSRERSLGTGRSD
jgi:hypothetical protein